MSPCKHRMDLQTLGSQPTIMPKNLPDHCSPHQHNDAMSMPTVFPTSDRGRFLGIIGFDILVFWGIYITHLKLIKEKPNNVNM